MRRVPPGRPLPPDFQPRDMVFSFAVLAFLPMKSRRLAVALGLLLALVSVASAGNYKFVLPHDPIAPPQLLDEGDFNVSLNGRAIGHEHFAWGYHRDSLLIEAEFTQLVGPQDTLLKHVNVVVRAFDYDLHQYQSEMYYQHRQQGLRGITRGDTVFTAYREGGQGGEGTAYRHPGGRLFVIEPMCYTLLDIVARNFGGREFTTWPVNLFVLGERDSLLEGEARSLGTETIRWGSKPVVAQKVSISDGTTPFHVWIGPQGTMLRATVPGSGMVIEREAPPVKRAAPPRPRAATGAKGAAATEDRK